MPSLVQAPTSWATSHAGLEFEAQYDNDCLLIGCNLLAYRLERKRVTAPAIGERNFHIFYYLLAGSSVAELTHLGLDTKTGYRYLGNQWHRFIKTNGCQDFTQLKASLKKIGFTHDHVGGIFQVLSAILHLGQLEFHYSKDEDRVVVRDNDALNVASVFLGIRTEELKFLLGHRTSLLRKERVTLVLDEAGAREQADELARVVYCLLFHWVIEEANHRLSRADAVKCLTIGDFLVRSQRTAAIHSLSFYVTVPMRSFSIFIWAISSREEQRFMKLKRLRSLRHRISTIAS